MTIRTRDQKRAEHAYSCVEAILNNATGSFDDYKIAVNSLGPSVLRSGLSSAIAMLCRGGAEGESAASQLLFDLTQCNSPQLTLTPPPQNKREAGLALLKKVRAMPLPDYMIATREVLRMSLWLKRAVQSHSSTKPAATSQDNSEE